MSFPGPSVNLSPDEDRLLRVVVGFQREHDRDVGSSTLLRSFSDWNLSHLREVCRELQERGLIRTRDLDTSDLFRVASTGRATALLKGYPIIDGHLSTIVSFDRETLTRLVETLATLHKGQDEVVEACKAIANELSKPPASSTAERIQAAMAILVGVLQAEPFFTGMVLPLLRRWIG